MTNTMFYVPIHTEDGRRICRNMYLKLKNVVLVIKLTTLEETLSSCLRRRCPYWSATIPRKASLRN